MIILLIAAGAAWAQESTSSTTGSGQPPRGKPPTAAELIQKLDKDGDGKVSKAEFDGPAEHFAASDINSDGYISSDEGPSGPPPGGQQQRQ
jgi:hypothetical protein